MAAIAGKMITNVRKRGLLPILALLLVILVAGLWIYYLIAGRLPQLPLVERTGLNQPIYSFSIEGVTHPVSVAVSADGQRIYVAEGDGERLIRIFDPTGKQISSFSNPDTTAVTRKPTYIAIGPDGQLYVTDPKRPGIDIYTPTGRLTATWVPQINGGQKWLPTALAFDKEGKLYVTDLGLNGHRVVVLNRDGTVSNIIEGKFAFPNGIAVDDQGRIFVADSNNGQIKVFDKSGQPLGNVGKGGEGQRLGLPRGLAFDQQGRLVVVDTFDHTLQVFSDDASPQFQFSLGKGFGYGDGQFAYPNSLAIDSHGRIYVADRDNNRVQVWF